MGTNEPSRRRVVVVVRGENEKQSQLYLLESVASICLRHTTQHKWHHVMHSTAAVGRRAAGGEASGAGESSLETRHIARAFCIRALRVALNLHSQSEAARKISHLGQDEFVLV